MARNIAAIHGKNIWKREACDGRMAHSAHSKEKYKKEADLVQKPDNAAKNQPESGFCSFLMLSLHWLSNCNILL